MALPIGTALHHGVYVLDALWGEDSIGPLYLATHVPTGQWVQVRIVGSRHPECIPSSVTRTAFYEFLKSVRELGHPAFDHQLYSFEEDGIGYQVFSAELGYPLSHLISPHSPADPQRSLQLIQQIVSALEALRPLGWRGLSLAADQLWQKPTQQPGQVVLTGFDVTRCPAPEHASGTAVAALSQEAILVEELSRLLYFLLTGQPSDNRQAPLAVDLKHRLPTLHPGFITALERGIAGMEQARISRLPDWLALLPKLDSSSAPASTQESTSPERPAPHPSVPRPAQAASGGHAVHPSTPASTAATTVVPPMPPSVAPTEPAADQAQPVPESPVDPPSRRPAARRSLALVSTSIAASFVGLAVGLHNRLQPVQLLPTGNLNPEQTFPPLSDWPGGELERSQEFSPDDYNRPDYGDAPARRASPPSSEEVTPASRPVRPAVTEPAPAGNNADAPVPTSSEFEDVDPAPMGEEGISDPFPQVAPAPIAPAPLESTSPLPPAQTSPVSPAPLPLDVQPPTAPTPAPAPINPVAPPPAPLAPVEPPVAPAPTTTSSQSMLESGAVRQGAPSS